MKQNTHKKTHTVIPLLLVGIASSFTFVLTVMASGIVPSDVVALANSARERVSLPALTENAQLSQAARAKALDMIKNDYFAHTSPNGREPWYWIKQAGYQYQAAGENLAINYTNAREQHDAWMKSATHRANILNTRYQEIGVAVVQGKIDGKDTTVTVEMFGSPLHAVADRVAVVPPVAVPAPDIKGVEDPVILDVAPIAPASLVTVVPAPVTPVVTENPLLSLAWQETLWLSIFVLSLFSAPLAFFGRAIGLYVEIRRMRAEAAKQGTETVDIPVMAPLDIDGIHHKSA